MHFGGSETIQSTVCSFEEASLGRSSPTYSDSEMNEPSTSTSCSTANESTVSDDLFIRHRVKRRDTLAGLAVKYNVTVSDIKRANGFQNDTEMFGKDTLLIPTRPLPIGPEYAAWAGMILAHYGRFPGHLNSDRLRASSAAAISELRGYYQVELFSETSAEVSDEDLLDVQAIFAPAGSSRRQSPREVEVELTTRPQTQSAGHLDDRLRLRRRGAEDDYAAAQEGVYGYSPPKGSGIGGGSSSGGGHLLATRTAVNTGLRDLKEWHRKSSHWRSQLVGKLKRATNQPALTAAAQSAGSSMAQAAEAAMALASGLSASAPLGKVGRKAD